MSPAVERYGRVAARIVRTAREVGDARNQCALAGTVELRGAAPRCSTVVREVGTRVAVTVAAAGAAIGERAGPGAGHVVIGGCHEPIRLVGIDRDRGLVLWRRGRVLVDRHIRRLNRRAVQWAREDVGWRDDRRRTIGGPGILRLLLDERGKPNLEAGGPIDRGHLTGEGRDVVGRLAAGLGSRQGANQSERRDDTENLRSTAHALPSLFSEGPGAMPDLSFARLPSDSAPR